MDKKTTGQERRMYKNSKVGQRTASHMFSLNLLLSFSFFLSSPLLSTPVQNDLVYRNRSWDLHRHNQHRILHPPAQIGPDAETSQHSRGLCHHACWFRVPQACREQPAALATSALLTGPSRISIKAVRGNNRREASNQKPSFHLLTFEKDLQKKKRWKKNENLWRVKNSRWWLNRNVWPERSSTKQTKGSVSLLGSSLMGFSPNLMLFHRSSTKMINFCLFIPCELLPALHHSSLNHNQ